MGSSTTNPEAATPKQRKGKNAKGNNQKETPTEPASSASGNDAKPRIINLSKVTPTGKIQVTTNPRPVSISEAPEVYKLKATSSESTYGDDLKSSLLDPVDNSIKSFYARMKQWKPEILSTGVSWKPWVEWVMGVFVILCMIYPGFIGQLPMMPRLLYEAFEPFSWYA